MSEPYDPFEDDSDRRARKLRWMVYSLLITATLGTTIGRILAVNSVDQTRLEAYRINQRMNAERKKLDAQGIWGAELEERLAKAEKRVTKALKLERPFLSSNDRSRWAAARALTERGTFEIDEVIQEPGWDTIDKVKHKGRDGRWHLYSSKPPMMSMFMAGAYHIVYRFSGLTLGENPYAVARIILIVFNGGALLVFLCFAVKMAERWGESDWAKVFVAAAACWGTFLTTFAVVINNHLIAAACAMASLYAAMRIWRDEERDIMYFLMAGFFGAFTVTLELPALSFFCLIVLAIAWRNMRGFLYGFVPAALLVVIAFFLSNYTAHGSFRPPYMHRSEGAELFTLAPEHAEGFATGRVNDALRGAFKDAGHELSESVLVDPYDANVKGDDHGTKKMWLVTDYGNHDKYPIIQSEDGLVVHAWDNWYDYDYIVRGRVRDSYWRNQQGRSKIDQGEASRGRYAWHVLLGHHGIFSLTPMWILSMVGIVILLRNPDPNVRWTAIFVAVLTFVCVSFYLMRPLGDRNYGGMTSGFRWMFWFAPLWLWTMIPTAEAAAGKWIWRSISLLLLGFSAMSAAYPTWNPWTQPWIYRYMEYLGWL